MDVGGNDRDHPDSSPINNTVFVPRQVNTSVNNYTNNSSKIIIILIIIIITITLLVSSMLGH